MQGGENKPDSPRALENGKNGKASFFLNDEHNDTHTRTSQAFVNNGFDNTKL